MNNLKLKRLAANQWIQKSSLTQFHPKVCYSHISENPKSRLTASLHGSNIYKHQSNCSCAHSVFSNRFCMITTFLNCSQLHQLHTTSQYNMPPFISRRVYIQWHPSDMPPSAPSEPTSTLVLSDTSAPEGTGRFVDVRIHQHALAKPNNNILSAADIDWAIAGVCTSTPLNPEHQENKEVVYTRKASFLHEIDSRGSDYTDEGLMCPTTDGSGDELEHAVIFNPEEGVLMACEERWTDSDADLLPGRNRKECIIMRIRRTTVNAHKGQLLLLGTHMQAIVAGNSGELHLQRWEYKTNDVGRWELIASLGAEGIIPNPDHILAGEDLKVNGLVWEVIKKIEW